MFELLKYVNYHLLGMTRETREDRIRDKYVRGNIGVTSIVDKMRENRLRGFKYVMRREKTKAVRGYENVR